MHVPTHLYSRTRFGMHMPGGRGFVAKVQLGLSNYNSNQALNAILTRAELVEGAPG